MKNNTTKDEEQAKIIAVLRASDERNNQSTIPDILAEIRRRHLERASQITTQVVDK